MKTPFQLTHIIYVDDDDEDRAIFREAHGQLDNPVALTILKSGRELVDYLELLKGSEHLPSSIICDMQMPMINGMDVLKLLKREPRWNKIPVVIFSTSSNSRDSQMAKDLGALAFFSKPNSFREVRLMIKEILELCQDNSNPDH